MTMSWRSLFVVLTVAALAAEPQDAVAAGAGGLSSAQVAKLRRAGIPVVVPARKPSGYHALEPVVGPGSYRLVYVSGSSRITFDFGGSAARGSPGSPASAPQPAPKRGFFQRLLHGGVKGVTGAQNGDQGSPTKGETEGQGTAAIMADSRLVGPIRLTPSGGCLHGSADSSKGQLRALHVTVSGCNFDDPDVLTAAYKSLKRV